MSFNNLVKFTTTRLQCMHAVHKVRPTVLQISHVRVLVKQMYCAKTAQPIEMPFGGLTEVGPKNHVLDGVKIPHKKVRFCMQQKGSFSHQ